MAAQQDTEQKHTAEAQAEKAEVTKTQVTLEEEDIDEDHRAYVVKYNKQAQFSFEVGDIVYILKPGYRAPLGGFRIARALAGDTWELVKASDNTPHTEVVEGRYLRRDV